MVKDNFPILSQLISNLYLSATLIFPFALQHNIFTCSEQSGVDIFEVIILPIILTLINEVFFFLLFPNTLSGRKSQYIIHIKEWEMILELHKGRIST